MSGNAVARRPRLVASPTTAWSIWILAVLFAGGGFIVWFGYQVYRVPLDAYAVWWTADLV